MKSHRQVPSKMSYFVLFSFSLCVCLRLCIHACRDGCAKWTTTTLYSSSSTFGPSRGLSRLEHDISRWHSHVGGRGCVRCVRNYGPLLQVSRSTQKLLALSKVSEQADQGSDPRFFLSICLRKFTWITLVHLLQCYRVKSLTEVVYSSFSSCSALLLLTQDAKLSTIQGHAIL